MDIIQELERSSGSRSAHRISRIINTSTTEIGKWMLSYQHWRQAYDVKGKMPHIMETTKLQAVLYLDLSSQGIPDNVRNKFKDVQLEWLLDDDVPTYYWQGALLDDSAWRTKHMKERNASDVNIPSPVELQRMVELINIVRRLRQEQKATPNTLQPLDIAAHTQTLGAPQYATNARAASNAQLPTQAADMQAVSQQLYLNHHSQNTKQPAIAQQQPHAAQQLRPPTFQQQPSSASPAFQQLSPFAVQESQSYDVQQQLPHPSPAFQQQPSPAVEQQQQLPAIQQLHPSVAQQPPPPAVQQQSSAAQQHLQFHQPANQQPHATHPVANQPAAAEEVMTPEEQARFYRYKARTGNDWNALPPDRRERDNQDFEALRQKDWRIVH